MRYRSPVGLYVLWLSRHCPTFAAAFTSIIVPGTSSSSCSRLGVVVQNVSSYIVWSLSCQSQNQQVRYKELMGKPFCLKFIVDLMILFWNTLFKTFEKFLTLFFLCLFKKYIFLFNLAAQHQLREKRHICRVRFTTSAILMWTAHCVCMCT